MAKVKTAKKEVKNILMGKLDLVDIIAENNNMTKTDAKKNLEMVLDAIVVASKQLKNKGDKLRVIEFFTLSKEIRSARDGKHPRTKEVIHIPAKPYIKVSLGKKFK